MQKLVELAKKRFAENQNYQMDYLADTEISAFVNDLKQRPHSFVLACLMTPQIIAERAWRIPYEVCKKFGSGMTDLVEVPEDEYLKFFNEKGLHRNGTKMAGVFHKALLRIRDVYNNDASKIWSGNPSSSTVVYRFLQFYGCGIKISTMATNILARDFKVPFSDHYSIDISPDRHVKRVMKRIGYVDEKATPEMIIYKARELNPEYPGIIDISCFEIGRDFCKPTNPNCKECIVRDECKSA